MIDTILILMIIVIVSVVLIGALVGVVRLFFTTEDIDSFVFAIGSKIL